PPSSAQPRDSAAHAAPADEDVRRRESGVEAAALAVIMIVASPILVHSLKMFGTEYPLLLAIAGVLYFSFASQHRFAWIGLGVAIGLGLLAKTSFVVVLIPLLIARRVIPSMSEEAGRARAAEDLVSRRPRSARSLAHARDDIAAIILGLLIASTWWVRNIASAIRFGLRSRAFAAHSLGPPFSIATFVRWSSAVTRCCSGYGIAAVFVIAIAMTIARRRLNSFAIATTIAALPLIIGAYSGSNHNPRLLAPALFLLIAAIASLATEQAIVLIV